jgi:hypothetical protein
MTMIETAPVTARFPQSTAKATGKAMTTNTADRDQAQFLARATGFLFIVTFVTSIPPVLTLYGPALSDPAFVLGGGYDAGVSWGALLELVLIIANIGTALTVYPVFRRHFPVLSLGYVTARLTECGFIALGIVALLALNTLRRDAGAGDHAALQVVGQALVAVHDWTFRLGPGVVVGVGNGLMLGYMMWQSRLVPRALSILGLVGGPLILLSGAAVVLGYIEAGSVPQGIATVPEFLWELSLGFWLLMRGFNANALSELEASEA